MHHINYLFDIIVLKNDLDIHLFKFLIQDYRKSENNFIIHKFNNRNENFIKIDFFSLFKIANNSVNFILNDLVCKFSFDFINSFIS